MNKTRYLIGIDTVFECTIVLICIQDNAYVLQDFAHKTGQRHQAACVLGMLDALLKKNKLSCDDIDMWAYNEGPGAFSGIRIDTAVVQACALVNDDLCLGISSLMYLAMQLFWVDLESDTLLDGNVRHKYNDTMDNNTIHNNAIDHNATDADAINNNIIDNSAINTAMHGSSFNEAFQINCQKLDNKRIVALIDARQNEFYAATFTVQNGKLMVQKEAHLLPHDASIIADIVITNSDIVVNTDNCTATIICKSPCAQAFAQAIFLAYGDKKGVCAAHALPKYIRNNAWKTLAEQGK